MAAWRRGVNWLLQGCIRCSENSCVQFYQRLEIRPIPAWITIAFTICRDCCHRSEWIADPSARPYFMSLRRSSRVSQTFLGKRDFKILFSSLRNSIVWISCFSSASMNQKIKGWNIRRIGGRISLSSVIQRECEFWYTGERAFATGNSMERLG